MHWGSWRDTRRSGSRTLLPEYASDGDRSPSATDRGSSSSPAGGLVPREGDAARRWAACSSTGPARDDHESSILTSNVDPGTMSPFQHGEVFRDRRRRRNGSRSGPLRAVHRSGALPDEQRHHGPDLTQRHHQRSGAASSWDRRSRSSRTSPTEIKASMKRIAPDNGSRSSSRSAARSVTFESLPFLEAIRQFRQGSRPRHALSFT